MTSGKTQFVGRGWQRDLPDPRDVSYEDAAVQISLSSVDRKLDHLPLQVDLSRDADGFELSTPSDQGQLHVSSAMTCAALLEYFQRRCLLQDFVGSAAFVYRMTKRMQGLEGNVPTGLRDSLKVIARFGLPPTYLLPDRSLGDTELLSDLCLLGFQDAVRNMIYFRIAAETDPWDDVLHRIKRFLAAGFPVTLGFSMPRGTADTGFVPYRPKYDSYSGGQSVLVVGYDDTLRHRQLGSLRIRGCWGPQWGQNGYGWLPYWYVSRGLAHDFWTAIGPAWSNSPFLFDPRLHVTN